MISSASSSSSPSLQSCFSAMLEVVNPSATFTARSITRVKAVRAIAVAVATLGIHRRAVAGSFRR